MEDFEETKQFGVEHDMTCGADALQSVKYCLLGVIFLPSLVKLYLKKCGSLIYPGFHWPKTLAGSED